MKGQRGKTGMFYPFNTNDSGLFFGHLKKRDEHLMQRSATISSVTGGGRCLPVLVAWQEGAADATACLAESIMFCVS